MDFSAVYGRVLWDTFAAIPQHGAVDYSDVYIAHVEVCNRRCTAFSLSCLGWESPMRLVLP